MKIGQPTKCPFCKKVSYYISLIEQGLCTKKCRSCQIQDRLELPKIQKKVIYLDQFVLSKIMMSLNGNHPSHEKILKADGDFWIMLFKKLDRLTRAQLIICPKSFVHHNESMLFEGYFTCIREIYDHLSCGIMFGHREKIKDNQILHDFSNFLQGKQDSTICLYPECVTSLTLNNWVTQLGTPITLNPFTDEYQYIKSSQDGQYKKFKILIEKWRDPKNKLLIKDLLDRELQASMRSFSPSLRVTMIDQCKKKNGDFGLAKIAEYLQSRFYERIPYIMISSACFAHIANKVAVDRRIKKLPNIGTFNDIEAVSCFLPYADAMFIDNVMAGYLKEKPLSEEIAKYSTKTFCSKTKEDLLDYLNEIENNNSSHLKKVKNIYGAVWDQCDIDNIFTFQHQHA